MCSMLITTEFSTTIRHMLIHVIASIHKSGYIYPGTPNHARAFLCISYLYILALRGAIVLLKAFFSSVSSTSGKTPSSLIFAKNSCP